MVSKSHSKQLKKVLAEMKSSKIKASKKYAKKIQRILNMKKISKKNPEKNISEKFTIDVKKAQSGLRKLKNMVKKYRFNLSVYLLEEKDKYGTRREDRITLYDNKRYKKIFGNKTRDLEFDFTGLNLRDIRKIGRVVLGADTKSYENMIRILQKSSVFDDFDNDTKYLVSQLDNMLFLIDDITEGTIRNLEAIEYDNVLMKDTCTETPKLIQSNYMSLSNIIPNEWDKMCVYDILIHRLKKGWDQKHKQKLTRELIYESIFEKPFCVTEAQKGLSIKHIVSFFTRNRITSNLYFFNIYMRLVFKHRPEKTTKAYPWGMYLIVHNNHLYCLDKINSLVQNAESRENLDLTPSKYYKFSQHDDMEIIVCNDEEEFSRIFCENTKRDKKRVAYSGCMTKLYFYCVSNLDIKPHIMKAKAGKIHQFVVNTFNVMGNPMQCESNNIHLYNKKLHEIHGCILNKQNISQYSEKTQDLLMNYGQIPLRGKFCDYLVDKPVFEMDFNKFYCSIIEEMEYIPSINIFDEFREIEDGHKIERWNLYLVSYCRHAQQNYSLVYGRHLKNLKNTISYLRPSTLQKNTVKEKIKQLFESELSTNAKKFIPNMMCGLCGKTTNKKEIHELFEDPRECFTMAQVYGGKISIVRNNDEEHYLHTMSEKNVLCDGFLLIYLYIMDRANFLLHQLMNNIPDDIRICGTNTDALYIQGENCERIVATYPHLFGEKRGQLKFSERDAVFRLENGDTVKGPYETIIKKYNGYILERVDIHSKNIEHRFLPKPCVDVHSKNINNIEIKNEWDVSEILTKIENRTVILGECAGAGKSHIFKNLKKEDTLFISPYNALCQDITKTSSIHSITKCKLFGERLNNLSQIVENNFRSVSNHEYKNIVFDEICLMNISSRAKIYKYILENPSKNFYSNGDGLMQLPPIEDFGKLNNILDKKEYYQQSLFKMFPNLITLRENKRCLTVEDRTKCSEIAELFRNKDMENIKEYLKQNFDCVDKLEDIQTDKCIVFRNHTKRHINSLRFKGYSIDTKLVCNSMISQNGVKTIINFIYAITDITDNKYKLDNGMTFTKQELDKWFSLTYARTCHSLQGMSINEPVTICDMNDILCSREYVYTAITRNVSLGNIKFCFNDVKYDLNKRVEGYINQDRKAGRQYDSKNYIDAAFIIDLLKKCRNRCCLCSNIMTDWVVDRIDNTIGHVKGNCQILCKNCNCSKK